MDIVQNGDNLVIKTITRQVIDVAKQLPGRKRWKDGMVVIEASGPNIEFLLSHFPGAAELGLPAVDSFLGVREQEARVLEQKSLPAEAAFFPFKTKPFEHQLKAFSLSRHAEYFGLFMEMGTGKTKILVDNAFALYSEGYLDRVIVVTINGVHQQWVDQQIPEHAPDFPWEARAYSSGLGVKAIRDMEEAAEDFSKLQFMTMAFESLASKRAQEMFIRWARSGRVMIILDESQKIKNPSAARTKFLLKQAEYNMGKRGYRRIATGTEVTQGLEDLYTQLKFLHPAILGHNSFYSFRNEYCRLAPIPGAPAGAYRITGYQNVDRLKQRIEGCTFRVMKKDCLDLPQKVYVQRFVNLSPEQDKAYKSLKKYMVAEMADGTVIEAPLAITLLMKLQQVVSGQLIDEAGVTHKLPTERLGAVVDILEERKSAGLEATAIIWARFRADIERLKETLEEQGYRVGTYFGDTSQEERTEIIQPGAVDILIANPASAGAGLNLTHFNLAIYYSNSFNAADRWQSEDRIHRIGQTEHCTYVDLVAPGTVDTKLVEALSRKKDIADSVRKPAELLADVLGL